MTLPAVPFCRQYFVGAINPAGGREPICVRCFLVKTEHQRLEREAHIPPSPWPMIPVPNLKES
jgi:hypothetical protein